MQRAIATLTALIVSTVSFGQTDFRDDSERIRVAPIKMPYSGARNVPELSDNPDYLEAGGLVALLEDSGAVVKPIPTISLTREEENDYGTWHRLALANAHLGDVVAQNLKDGYLTVGLLANCNSVIGVLGGLQRSGPTRRPLKDGLVFIDAHGDFNTPETTLSGMLGGMPVAISAGMCRRNLRLTSRLDPALPTRYIVTGAVRDTDPLEQELIDKSDIVNLTVDELRNQSDAIGEQMKRLSTLVDLIYVHIDMDVLDPREVAGHPLTVPNGPTSVELGDALSVMFRFPKVAALGIASTPAGERDPEELSRKAAYNLIEGALRGVSER